MISQWLTIATQKLQQSGVTSAWLDAEVLLAHALGKSRTWLHAHGNEPLQGDSLQTANRLAARRLAREPIAYLTGRKEFYGREFIVTRDVLIPRPESETMIDLLKSLHSSILVKNTRSKEQIFLIDVGTGSGCLGITAKLELPKLDVTIADISPAALGVAQENAKILHADVRTIESNLLSGVGDTTPTVDFILANLPYVDKTWERSPETDHEPALALFAEQHGLALIYDLLEQAPHVLTPSGYVLLEADPEQHDAIISRGAQHGLQLETVRNYIVVLRR